MAAPVLPLRERILANMVTTLQTISVGNGYATTLDTVVRGYLSPLEHFGFPSASIIPVDDPEEWTPQTAQHEFHCFIRLWIDETPETAPTTIQAVCADIAEALQVDTTRGGVAEYTMAENTLFPYEVSTERFVCIDLLYRVDFKTSIVSPRIGV
jgi:hypothetical protein